VTVTAMAQAPGISTFALTTGLLGGLALFLLGLESLADSLKALAGPRMKAVLARLTTNRFTGALTGAFVTAVIQSSSVTTVLVVGFISAGLMSLSQSIGIIMGANIGTTVTAQIIAFKVTQDALLMVAAGFAMTFFGKRERMKLNGQAVLGLGLVFFGMAVMGDAMRPLRTFQPFLDWMVRMESPALGILAGAAFTALVQSSSATTGVVIVMASQGLISLTAGIALAFGANVGTCVTALLAAIGKTREAVRAAVVHVGFNVVGVLIWLPFIGLLSAAVVQISPTAPTLTGTARLAAETPRQIANAHTVFNVANTLLFIWFVPLIARVVERLVPDRPIAEEALVRARYLDRELLKTPSLALDRVRLEILHMGDRVREMLTAVQPAMTVGDRESLVAVADMDDGVDALHGHIVTYLGKISKQPLTDSETDELVDLLEAANNLENIGDIIETNLVALGLQRIEKQVRISPATMAILDEFHGRVASALALAVQAVTQNNRKAASLVVGMKKDINRMAGAAALHEAERLVAEEPNRLPAYTIETDILKNLKRVYYFCKRMARSVLPGTKLGPDSPDTDTIAAD
jgi:phosphate:Na+ symporter